MHAGCEQVEWAVVLEGSACVRVRVRVRVRVCACVRVCVRVCVCLFSSISDLSGVTHQNTALLSADTTVPPRGPEGIVLLEIDCLHCRTEASPGRAPMAVPPYSGQTRLAATACKVQGCLGGLCLH
jgi:hypothetical protein